MKYKRNNEFIAINGKNIEFSVDFSSPQNEGDFFLSIPSLKIYSSVKSRGAIQKELKDSIDSFINYWFRIKGRNEFMNHLRDLGFSSSRRNVAQSSLGTLTHFVSEAESSYESTSKLTTFKYQTEAE